MIKHFYIYLILSTLLFTTLGCSNVEKQYFPNGTISASIPTKGGEYHGMAHYYFPDGQLKMSIPYADGVVTGTAIFYRRNGHIERKEQYLNDMLNGEVIAFSNQKVVTIRSNYINDTLDGSFEEFYSSNGALKVKGNFEKGVYHGKWSYWSDAGEKIGEGEYYYGAGKQQKWYESGELLMEQEYKNNLLHGKEVWYNRDGTPIRTAMYENGVLKNEQHH